MQKAGHYECSAIDGTCIYCSSGNSTPASLLPLQMPSPQKEHQKFRLLPTKLKTMSTGYSRVSMEKPNIGVQKPIIYYTFPHDSVYYGGREGGKTVTARCWGERCKAQSGDKTGLWRSQTPNNLAPSIRSAQDQTIQPFRVDGEGLKKSHPSLELLVVGSFWGRTVSFLRGVVPIGSSCCDTWLYTRVHWDSSN